MFRITIHWPVLLLMRCEKKSKNKHTHVALLREYLFQDLRNKRKTCQALSDLHVGKLSSHILSELSLQKVSKLYFFNNIRLRTNERTLFKVMNGAVETLPVGMKFACDTFFECQEVIRVQATVNQDGLTLLFSIPYGSYDSSMEIYSIEYFPLYDKETGNKFSVLLC